jgi:hypothetical protein
MTAITYFAYPFAQMEAPAIAALQYLFAQMAYSSIAAKQHDAFPYQEAICANENPSACIGRGLGPAGAD